MLLVRLTIGCLAALALMGIGGCGKDAPREARVVVEEAGLALKGEQPSLKILEGSDDAAKIKAEFDDGTEF